MVSVCILAAWLGVGCESTSGAVPGPAAVTSGLEAAPFLVGDLAPGNKVQLPFAQPLHFVEVGSTVFFTAEDGLHGRELWKTDGTREGTVLVTDLLPGLWGSEPTQLTRMGNHLYFSARMLVASRDVHGLWRTDGTAQGTELVLALASPPSFITEHDGALYFEAMSISSPYGFTLWRSDGTPAGTRILKEVASGARFDAPATWIGDTLIFPCYTWETGQELWKTDGTPEGTVLIKDAVPGREHLAPYAFFRMGDRLLFWGLVAGGTRRLWTSDGTEAGTVQLGTVLPDRYGTGYPPIAVVGDLAYFSGWDAQGGQELWRTDGTPEGTVRVIDLVAGSLDSAPQFPTAHEGKLYFRAKDATGLSRMWRLDAPGVAPVQFAGVPGLDLGRAPMMSTPGGLFFQAWDGDQQQLWRTDGTESGTFPFFTMAPGLDYRVQLWAWDRLFFSATDGELLMTDGTAEGTRSIPRRSAIEAGAFDFDNPNDAVDLDGTLFFTAPQIVKTGTTQTLVRTLWSSDGTGDGTRQVTETATGGFSLSPMQLMPLNGQLLFLTGGSSSSDLWRLEGSTRKLQRLGGAAFPSGSRGLVATGTRGYFSQRGYFGGWELWTTDATLEGTVRLSTGPGTSPTEAPRWLTPGNETLYFAWRQAYAQDSLWKSDGTQEGTVMLKSFRTESDSSEVLGLLPVGRRVFLQIRLGGINQLWVTEGTAGSTRFLVTLPGSTSDWAAVGDTLYLSLVANNASPRLWKYDGQTLQALHDFGTASNTARPGSLTAVGPLLVFWASDGASGYELWRSDGTPGGTVRVKDLNPGPVGAVAVPERMFALGPQGPVVFAAADGASGMELWKTDGTTEGTVRVVDVLPGPHSSSPKGLATAGRHFFFSAWTPEAGRELWALPREVADTTPPTLTCPGAQEAEAVSSQGAPVRYPAATAVDAEDPRPTVRMSYASGDTLPLGTTAVQALALDDTGNTATCTFDITVRDTTPPALTCPPDLRREATSRQGAFVSAYEDAVAMDTVSRVALDFQPPAWGDFPLGTTPVRIRATDASGNARECTFDVIVSDTQAPTLAACPPDLSLEATGPQGAVATYTLPLATDAASPTRVEALPPSGHTFAFGRTPVAVKAYDSSGNEDRCAFFVTVKDTRPPDLGCPPRQERVTNSNQGAVVEWPEAQAEDVASPVTLSYIPARGSLFAPGTTAVRAIATDTHGNARECTFDVTVKVRPPPPVRVPPSDPGPAPDTDTGGCQQAGGADAGVWGLFLLALWAFPRRARAKAAGMHCPNARRI
ncbi:HYR domain-containing protein [Corallococcus praedator]|uniref:HYR domain-containing protein n=1 Tax=Corallococcus praedator TaxID=2316724 RepID=A0ABX9QQM8_9BACT|nr:HYR domain-containing protein [Corallococcus sp. CA031C]RKI15708.1 HYR domain-containing protein [Corallococcus praedator]